jgi:RNA polymerase sigma-70 factor (ECF subfamily)
MSPPDERRDREERPATRERHPAAFRTTHWSVVRSAGGRGSAADEALSTLCEAYWYPVYAFVRRSGYSAEEAHDLTQGFFTRLLEKRDIESADPGRGRFRSYLLGSVRHFLSNERDRELAAKRGGGQRILSIDGAEADQRYTLEPVETETPEKLFLRQWALTLVDAALNGLAEEYADRGKRLLFERLRHALVGESGETSRSELAEELGMSETAINVTVHRMRRRFRQRLKEAVGHTLEDPGEAVDELGRLMAALSD